MSQRQTEARLAVARPLYSQVRDLLLERIKKSEWTIGQALPNEFNLAAEFGVSIGTARRAVEGLEETGIVVRKQGRGTYLAGPASTAVLGRFHPLRAEHGHSVPVTYTLVRVDRRAASACEQERLGLTDSGEVIEIVQRLAAGEAVRGLERSVAPASLLARPLEAAGLDRHCYLAYAEHGVFVIQADDRLSAILADAPSASELDVPISSPLLAVKRIAYALDRRPVELRFSMFALAAASYCCSIGQEARP